ncbi:hypothetical protein FRB99_002070, partial [Tulasnella sp. 403]
LPASDPRTGRPYSNAGYPVSLYHPVFSDFLKDIHDPNFVPKPDLLQTARELVIAGADYYPVEGARLDKITPILRKARTPVAKVEAETSGRQKVAKADGVVQTARPEGQTFRLIMEVKDEIGSDQSDPTIQGALSYSRYWSSFKFTVERLTDYMFIGGEWDDEPTVQRVEATSEDAENYQLRTASLYRLFTYTDTDPGPTRPTWEASPEAIPQTSYFYLPGSLAGVGGGGPTLPLDHDLQRLYPCIQTYMDSTGAVVEFECLKSLGGEFGLKLVFLASIVERSETSDDQPAQLIVVKFTRRCCIKAHQVLAGNSLASQLRYNGTAERSPDEYAMVVMDYIPDAFSTGLGDIPDGVMSDVEWAIKLPHAENIAFGDLRLPNVLAVKKEDETYGGMLVDFDWSGPPGSRQEGFFILNMILRCWNICEG